MLALGPRSVVVTLGADGATVDAADGGVIRLAGIAVDVTDTTGACDDLVTAVR
ncbi:hypothetical protein ABZV61_35760 [Streptomyces sp900116325]|uniref:Uncharacterized protein n=1 Tax=Streptomyces sp. 900116325 TaxID=3154295 RepID=A0ABV2ULM2_9ACTN